MKPAHFARTLICIAMLALFVGQSRAYGPDGHHIVGAIADERLANTPAGKKIAQMLDGMTLREAAQTPDTIKGWDKRAWKILRTRHTFRLVRGSRHSFANFGQPTSRLTTAIHRCLRITGFITRMCQ